MTVPVPQTRTRGPRALTLTGVALCVLAAAVAVLAGRLFVEVLPTGVLTREGEPGSAVVGVVPAPGSADVVLEEGRYAVWLATEEPVGEGEAGVLEDEIAVTAPDGVAVDVHDGGVQGTVSFAGIGAHTVATFETPAEGRYSVVAPTVGSAADARLLVVPATDFPGFFSGLLGTIGATFLAVALAAVGVGLAVGGGLVWASRRTALRRSA